MKAKKNQTRELSHNSPLYFVIGLTIILALIYSALEWKTEDDNGGYTSYVETVDEFKEKVPLVVWKTPPPPAPIIPALLKVKTNDFEGPETEVVITPPIDAPNPVDSVDYVDPNKNFDPVISIGVVEEVPIFPGCESATDKYACFNTMMKKHIGKNFKYPIAALNLDIQGKVHVMFEIQKDGSIGKIKLRGPHKTLEKEAARIINKLPTMIPGKQGGEPVRVPFSIPVTFKLSN